jgi:CheY-like chemotaxis protein
MKSLSILLIDDDEIERIKFKKVSQKTKFVSTFFEAKNGENAITLLKNKPSSFDLIITDLHMPVMNGFEFLEELKKSKKLKNIPVVVMSSSTDRKDLKKCYNLGVSGYFTKCLQSSEYISNVVSLLNYWQKSEHVNL